MKPLEINQEQKDRLIEMCKVLFPEYGEVQFLKSYLANIKDHTGSPYLRWYDDKSGETILIEIHWFEFCMTHLPKKLFKNLNHVKYWELTGKLLNISHNQHNKNVIHPIDYLYGEFKKLKL